MAGFESADAPSFEDPQGLVWPKIELEFEDNLADRTKFMEAFKKTYLNGAGYRD